MSTDGIQKNHPCNLNSALSQLFNQRLSTGGWLIVDKFCCFSAILQKAILPRGGKSLVPLKKTKFFSQKLATFPGCRRRLANFLQAQKLISSNVQNLKLQNFR